MFGAVVGVLATLVLGALVGFDDSAFQLPATLLLTVLVTSMTAVVTAVGYHELRLKVDGIDADELAAIFD